MPDGEHDRTAAPTAAEATDKPAVPSSLGDALIVLQEAALESARDTVQKIRLNASEASDSPSPSSKADGAAEPPIETRAGLVEWRKWAVDVAKQNADTVRPRRYTPDGAAENLPVLKASPNDLLETLGIVPTLYLDFLKFCFGFCLLGALQAALSLVFSAMHANETYDATALANAPPQGFLSLTLGARSTCSTGTCKMVNVISAVLEVLFSLMLLRGSKAFQARVARLAQVNDANNVYTREYAVQLHGMPRNATPDAIAKHIEKVLESQTTLAKDECKVFDVALILNAGSVLKNALKQAPLERKWAILDKRLSTLKNFRTEKHTGWDLAQKIESTSDESREVAEKLVKVREKIAKKGFKTISTVCGAFVTFENQSAAQEMLKLYKGGLSYLFQKPHLRYGGLVGKRLRAFPATQPRDILHENLPYRILAFNLRGLATFGRRMVSVTLLTLFLGTSFSFILVVNSLKEGMRKQLANNEAVPADLVGYVDSAFPTVASLVVVVVNGAIVALVGVLGTFGRYPTLSAMHTSKVMTIFVATVFNTAVLPVVVSMAPPPKFYLGAYAASCDCADPLFCCAFGPKGVLARGNYFTMSQGWYRDVGVLLVGSLAIQTVSAIATPLAPHFVDGLKRTLTLKKVTHRFDMEQLFAGPPIDLPKFIGKTYAFFFCVMLFSAVMPMLYVIGTVFFGGVWLAERFALLRIHQTPPPYSHELILDTLTWMPWLVCLHLGLGFWGYASLPAATLSGAAFTAPFGDATLDVLLNPSNASSGANATGAVANLLAGTGAAGEAVGFLEYLWDFSGHAGASWATLIMFVPTFIIFVVLVFLLLVPDVIERCVKRCLGKCLPGGGSSAQVMPNASDAAPDATAPAGSVLGVVLGGGEAPSAAEALESPSKNRPTTPNPFATLDVQDPPFSKVLRGVNRENVRTLDGKIVHEFQLQLTLSKWAYRARFLPDALLFRLLGMGDTTEPVTRAQWQSAKPLFTKLSRAADISYQPNYHPTYEKAFYYLTSEPESLAKFMEQDVAELKARRDRIAAIPDTFLGEEEEEGATKPAKEAGDDKKEADDKKNKKEGDDDDDDDGEPEKVPSLCVVQ